MKANQCTTRIYKSKVVVLNLSSMPSKIYGGTQLDKILEVNVETFLELRFADEGNLTHLFFIDNAELVKPLTDILIIMHTLNIPMNV